MWPGWWVDERVIFGIVGGSGYVNVYFWEGLSLGGKTPFEKVWALFSTIGSLRVDNQFFTINFVVIWKNCMQFCVISTPLHSLLYGLYPHLFILSFLLLLLLLITQHSCNNIFQLLLNISLLLIGNGNFGCRRNFETWKADFIERQISVLSSFYCFFGERICFLVKVTVNEGELYRVFEVREKVDNDFFESK